MKSPLNASCGNFPACAAGDIKGAFSWGIRLQGFWVYFEKVIAFHAVFRRKFPITGPMLRLIMVAVGESLQIELRQIVV